MLGIDSDIYCQYCNSQYKDNNLPRILTMCGHTYCQICIKKMIQQGNEQQIPGINNIYVVKCPQDGAKMNIVSKDLKIFPKNLALIKVLENKKNNSSFKDESFNLSKIVRQQQVQEDDLTHELITAMTQNKQRQPYEDLNSEAESNADQQQNHQEYEIKVQKLQKQQCEDEMCLLHQKPLQIICLNDQEKICSKCAIFGQHKGHNFKAIQEVQQDTTICYNQILKIFEEKEEIQKRILNQQTQYGLLDILVRKKDILEKQVRQQFRKLRQQVTKQQKKILKRLDQTYRATEIKIKALLKVDQQINTNFINWQSQSFELIKILQGSQLKDKIKILYSKQQKNTKILNAGQKVLEKMRAQENNLIPKVDQIISNLLCKKDRKIFEDLVSFIEILSESKKQLILQKQVVNEKPSNNIMKNTIACQSRPVLKNKINTSFFQKKSIQSIQGSPLLEQSLLDIEQTQKALPSSTEEFNSVIETFSSQISQLRKPLQPNQNILNKNHSNRQDSICCKFSNLELESAKKIPKLALKQSVIYMNKSLEQEDFETTSKSSIFTSRPSIVAKTNQNGQKPNKKKLKSIKVSQKYEKVLEGIYNNTLDTIDLTNGEIGDQSICQICQFIKFSKARTIKFIRNKLTDQGIQKILPFLSNAQILNLSQNNLTENVLDIFIKNKNRYLSGLKNVILSQNKIIQRKHKAKIDQLRSMNITVSV